MSLASLRRVAMTGFGSVGQGLARILLEHRDLPLVMTAVADRGGFVLSADGLDPARLLDAKATHGTVARYEGGRKGVFGANDLRESAAEVLVEAASTNFSDGEPGWSYVRTALEEGLDVVLASKGPLVAHWDELHKLAREKDVKIAISATHGAPLPAIDFARVALKGSRLNRLHALLNSTSGLLLEEMEKGFSLEEAIARISSVGVAETNPRLDIEGWDAAAKCLIIGRALLGGDMGLRDVDRQGIEKLMPSDVQAAAEAGTPIKLVCEIWPGSNGAEARVRPERLAQDDPLCSLRKGALGIVYDAEPVGPMFVGAYGAGGIPTAAAVIRDVLNQDLAWS